MAGVKVLFDAAQITMSDEEREQFGCTYGSVRAQADVLDREDLREEKASLAFDPLEQYK